MGKYETESFKIYVANICMACNTDVKELTEERLEEIKELYDYANSEENIKRLEESKTMNMDLVNKKE